MRSKPFSIILCFGLMSFQRSFAQPAPGPDQMQKLPLQFVTLAPLEAFQSVEAQIGHGRTCPYTDGKPIQSCLDARLKKKSWEIKLYRQPSESSEVIGKLIIKTIYQDLAASYVLKNGSPKDLPMEQVYLDGGMFFYSARVVRGDWIQLPKNPLPEAVWINLKQDFNLKPSNDQVVSVFTGTVYSLSDFGNIVIVKFENGNIHFRYSNPKDTGIRREQEVKHEKIDKVFIKSIGEFYDVDGHLKLEPAYPAGC